MSNLSLARIMFGSSEEVRRIAGSGLTANVSSFAPVALVPAVAAQATPSHSPLPGRLPSHLATLVRQILKNCTPPTAGQLYKPQPFPRRRLSNYNN